MALSTYRFSPLASLAGMDVFSMYAQQSLTWGRIRQQSLPLLLDEYADRAFADRLGKVWETSMRQRFPNMSMLPLQLLSWGQRGLVQENLERALRGAYPQIVDPSRRAVARRLHPYFITLLVATAMHPFHTEMIRSIATEQRRSVWAILKPQGYYLHALSAELAKRIATQATDEYIVRPLLLRWLASLPEEEQQAEALVRELEQLEDAEAQAEVLQLTAQARKGLARRYDLYVFRNLTRWVGHFLNTLITYPLETCFVRLATQGVDAAHPDGVYSPFPATIRQIVRTEGWRGLYSGVSTHLVTVGPMFLIAGLAFALGHCAIQIVPPRWLGIAFGFVPLFEDDDAEDEPEQEPPAAEAVPAQPPAGAGAAE